MILIVIYIVIYQLIALGGYLEKTPAENTVRLTLQQPTADSKTGKPCNPNHDSCDDDFTPPVDLPYCWNTSNIKQPNTNFDTYNCSFVDGAEAATIRADSIMMVTAVHSYSQKRSNQCSVGSNDCKKIR